MNHVPYVIGTDITQLTRWNFASNPVKYLRLARRILHPDELHEIWTSKPNVARALFPQVYIEPHGLQITGRPDRLDQFARLVKRPYHHTIARQSYERLLGSATVQRQVATLLGGRWAAKEAAKKAWGAHLLGWHDLRVRLGVSAKPGQPDNVRPGLVIELRPYIEPSIMEKFKEQIAERGVSPDEEMSRTASLSISHDGDYAIATVVAQPLDGLIWDALCERNRNLPLHGATRKLGLGDAKPPLVFGTVLEDEGLDVKDEEFNHAEEQDGAEKEGGAEKEDEGEEQGRIEKEIGAASEVKWEPGFVPWWKL